MGRMCLLVTISGLLAVLPASGLAQEAGAAGEFDPAGFGIVAFEEPRDLFSLLTAEGRCPAGSMAPERQPCAFVFYERVAGEGKRISFKPIFKVESSSVIWAMHDKRLKKVSIDQLYGDEMTIKGQVGRYRSFGIVGNAENAGNCSAAKPCLDRLVRENMFLMYNTIPDMVVQKLWHNRRVDPGVSVTTRQ